MEALNNIFDNLKDFLGLSEKPQMAPVRVRVNNRKF